ncbi:energy transducer TonB family protein [Polycladidibacter stylochi]|uniref:energy transducer TonB family protein n=1 Tax=Polycladidibacter stylochi TaxID=1807766 RepID=UPI00082F6A81|nr:energy transducer TonB [Pseudovibrio stylochi]
MQRLSKTPLVYKLLLVTLLSLAVHLSALAFFTKPTAKIEIAAKAGSALSVTGSLEDMVQGSTATQNAAEPKPLEELEVKPQTLEQIEPLKALKPQATGVILKPRQSKVKPSKVKPKVPSKPHKVVQKRPEKVKVAAKSKPIEPTKTPVKAIAPKKRSAMVKGANITARKGSSSKKKSNQPKGSGGRAKDGDIKGNALKSNYYGKVSKKLRRYLPRYYPRKAQSRNWKGTVTVGFTILASGKVQNVRVVRSSGREILDKAALKVVNKAAPFAKPPAGFGLPISIRVPLGFK